MDDKRVAAVLFYFFLDQGQGDSYIVEYIIVNGKGEDNIIYRRKDDHTN